MFIFLQVLWGCFCLVLLLKVLVLFVCEGLVVYARKLAVKQSLARRENLSFAGWKMDDDSAARVVGFAYSLKELEMYSLVISFSLSISHCFCVCCRACNLFAFMVL